MQEICECWFDNFSSSLLSTFPMYRLTYARGSKRFSICKVVYLSAEKENWKCTQPWQIVNFSCRSVHEKTLKQRDEDEFISIDASNFNWLAFASATRCAVERQKCYRRRQWPDLVVNLKWNSKSGRELFCWLEEKFYDARKWWRISKHTSPFNYCVSRNW